MGSIFGLIWVYLGLSFCVQARDRKFQAILPLRGKILNVERKEEAAIYKNQQVADMIVALGLGLHHEEFTAAKLRCNPIGGPKGVQRGSTRTSRCRTFPERSVRLVLGAGTARS